MANTIFITGASSGLGRATALLFADRGWTVFAAMREGSEVRSRLGAVGGVTILPLDVTKPDQVESAAQAALDRGPVDIVFANAGYALGGPLEGMTDAQLRRQIDTNLLGPIRTIKAFIPHFRERGRGGLLVTASAAGYAGMPLLSAYAATKFGLVGWAESLAYELPRNVFIKIIVPGSMKTNFLHGAERAAHPGYADLAARTDSLYTAAASSAQDGAPEAVAEAIWNAATDGRREVACYVTAEARQTVAGREALGAEGFREQVCRQLGP